MADDKLLCGLNYRSLNFTDAQYEEALKMISKPESANQILLALLDISSRGDNPTTAAPTTTLTTTSDTCSSSNSSVFQAVEDKAAFITTDLTQDKGSASSGYSSIISFSSSSNQSLKSLHQPLRKIYIDGSNIARTHGKDASFSWLGIQICVQWFHSRQHRMKVFVPEDKCKSADLTVMAYLNDLDALIKTPKGCNDDLFIIEAARQNNGVIVSNDKYRDEKEFDNELRRFIDLNRLPYIFVDDQFIPANDPRGRSGPSLNEFLKELPEISQHYRSQRHPQRYQRHDISVRQSQHTGVSSHPKLKSTCSLPTSFM